MRSSTGWRPRYRRRCYDPRPTDRAIRRTDRRNLHASAVRQGVCKSQGGSGALGDWAVVSDTLLFDRVSGPVKALDVARIAGCSETTIHRAFGLDTGISDLFREKIFSISKEIGYVRSDPYAKISKEFLTGRKTIYGTPEYNAELIIKLRTNGLSVRKISHASGIGKQTLSKILSDNNVSTINLQTKFINGLSKARTIALKTLQNKKTRFQLKVRSSETRKTIARIIKEYKKGRHIKSPY